MVKLVEITSKNCPVCKMMAPMLNVAIQPFVNTLDFKVYDAESPEGQHYVKNYNIKGAPVFLFYNANGDLIYRHQGSIALGEVRNRINAILTDATK